MATKKKTAPVEATSALCPVCGNPVAITDESAVCPVDGNVVDAPPEADE